MNIWSLTLDSPHNVEGWLQGVLREGSIGQSQKAEYLIPIFNGELLAQGKVSVKVLKTNDT